MIKLGVLYMVYEVMVYGVEGGYYVVGFLMGFMIFGLLEIGIFIGFLFGFILYFFS